MGGEGDPSFLLLPEALETHLIGKKCLDWGEGCARWGPALPTAAAASGLAGFWRLPAARRRGQLQAWSWSFHY